jgi:hypothetical protein
MQNYVHCVHSSAGESDQEQPKQPVASAATVPQLPASAPNVPQLPPSAATVPLLPALDEAFAAHHWPALDGDEFTDSVVVIKQVRPTRFEQSRLARRAKQLDKNRRLSVPARLRDAFPGR